MCMYSLVSVSSNYRQKKENNGRQDPFIWLEEFLQNAFQNMDVHMLFQ